MTYRGVYRDGIVVLEGEVGLRNGAAVEVTPARSGSAARKRVRKAPKRRAKSKAAPAKALPAFGLWKDRWPSSMSSAEVARRLREEVSRRSR